MNHGVRKIRIAVCGHRQLGDLQRLETGIQEACQLIRHAFPGADYQVYSCLAEGADRLLARHLTQALPAGLVAILPLPETDYLQDFEQPASVAEFQAIKQMASEVIVLQNAALRPQSYRVANDRLLGLADVLVAIWDGQPSQGPGGTGELVAEARQREMPVIWIQSGPGERTGFVETERWPIVRQSASEPVPEKEIPVVQKDQRQTRTKPNSHFRLFWLEIRWIVLGCAWLTGLILGVAGFGRFAIQNELPWTVGDRVYLTLQLVTLESGIAVGISNAMLEMARFLLPALTAYTLLQALKSLFREQLNWLRLWRLREHVIICGTGSRVCRLADELTARGYKVLVIRSSEVAHQDLHKGKFIVLEGEVSDPDLLIQSRVLHASHLVCLFDEDSQNVQLAIQAHQLSQQRTRNRLTCVVHLESAELTHLLKHSEMALGTERFQLEIYNPYAGTARVLMQEALVSQVTEPVHLLIIGFGRMGNNLVRQAALAWSLKKPAQPFAITIMDQAASEKVTLLLAELPNITLNCQITPIDLDLAHRNLFEKQLDLLSAHLPATHVFLCLSDQDLMLQVGLSLLRHPANVSASLFIQTGQDHAVFQLLKQVALDVGYQGPIISYERYERTCSADLILGGIFESLAQGLYRSYIRGIGGSEHRQTWDQLTDAEKDVNRQQANRLYSLVKAFGYQISPLQDFAAADFKIEPEAVVEAMAQYEHERWRKAKLAAGWRLGKVRDPRKRLHPDLVNWDDLPEVERQKNRHYIHQLPVLLARIGFQMDHTMRGREE